MIPDFILSFSSFLPQLFFQDQPYHLQKHIQSHQPFLLFGNFLSQVSNILNTYFHLFFAQLEPDIHDNPDLNSWHYLFNHHDMLIFLFYYWVLLSLNYIHLAPNVIHSFNSTHHIYPNLDHYSCHQYYILEELLNPRIHFLKMNNLIHDYCLSVNHHNDWVMMWQSPYLKHLSGLSLVQVLQRQG